MRAKKLFCCLAVSLLVMVASSSVQAAVRPLATVLIVKGEVSVMRNGARPAPLHLRSVLYARDTVSTGPRSGAALLFYNGAQVRLNASSSILIIDPDGQKDRRKVLFRQLKGQVWAALRPNDAVQTDTAIAGVRGTEIDLVVADDQTTTLTVLEGSVDFYNDAGAVTVQRLQQSVAQRGIAPTTPVVVQNPGFITEWSLDLSHAAITWEKFFSQPAQPATAAMVLERQDQARRAPESAEAHRNYGDALFDHGDSEAARHEYEAADHLVPRQAATLVRLGYASLRAGQWDEAEASFRLAREVSGPEGSAPAWTGLAWLELMHGRPQAAQLAAENAVAQAPTQLETRSEAQIALGVALFHQPGKLQAAEAALRAAGTPETSVRYQAQSWLAMVLLARDDRAGALQNALAAAQQAPWSGLAHGNLSLCEYYSGKTRAAANDARRAVALNPDSVAASVTLGQVLLAQGEVDEAAQVAARAVALDANLPQAQYLLGIAEASRRDYPHALRALRAAVDLEPEFLPAVNALARVYTLTGHQTEAVQMLTALLPRHRDAAEVQAALGDLHFEQHQYPPAIAAYHEAVRLRPASALYYNNLARVLLDANHLREAIEAGQHAVQLSPQTGQFHATLGLAYGYSGLSSQAEREFRTALTFDPQNALALAQLALHAQGNDLRAAESARSTQAFLLDPGVSRQLLRGGVTTEVTPQAGNQGWRDLSAVNRTEGISGRLQALSLLELQKSQGAISHDDLHLWNAEHYLTLIADPRTNLFFNVHLKSIRQELPGMDAQPDVDDLASFHFQQGQIAERRRIADGRYLWLGLFGNNSRYRAQNPDLDSFFSDAGFPIDRQEFLSSSLEPEVRLDWELGRGTDRPGLFSCGYSYADTDFDNRRHLVVGGGADSLLRQQDSDRTTIAYTQLTQRVSNRISLIAQLRAQHSKQRNVTSLTIPGGPPLISSLKSDANHVLPSLLVSYQSDHRTTFRLAAGRRVTEARTSTFAPVDTLVSTQAETLAFGTPLSELRVQLDAERYLSARDFVKLFVFRTTADNLQIGGTDPLGFGAGLPAADAPLLLLGRWRGYGAGARFESQVRRNLFFSAGWALRHTTSFSGTGPAAFDNGTAPYEPKHLGQIAFNYIDPSGTKIGLETQYVGAFYEDSPLALGRPRFPAQLYTNLQFAREPSVNQEIFLHINNIFNRPQVLFNGFFANHRSIVAGLTRRF